MRNDYFWNSHIIYSQNTYLFTCPRRFLSLKYNASFFSQSHLIVLPSLTPQTDISIFTDLDRNPNSLAGFYNLPMSPVCLLMPRPFPSETFSAQSPEMDSEQVRLFPHRDPSGAHVFSSSKKSVFSVCFTSQPHLQIIWQTQKQAQAMPITIFSFAVTMPYIINISLTKP